MAEILKVEHLIRNYEKPSRGDEKQEVKVIKDISFEIEEKEFVGIMGKSGCGKTTLLKVLDLSTDRQTERFVLRTGKLKSCGMKNFAISDADPSDLFSRISI